MPPPLSAEVRLYCRCEPLSPREDSYSELIGAGFSGAGCMGNEATRQRSKVYLRVKLHKNLECVTDRMEGLGYPDADEVQPF